MTLPDIDSARTWGADAWQNFDGPGEPTTDLDATIAKQMAADTAAMTHTAKRAYVRFQCATYTSGTQPLTVLDHDSVWGSSAPVVPTVVQVMAGVVIITWGATQTDELGASHTLNCRFPSHPAVIGSTDGSARIASFTANQITLYLYNAAGTLNALNGNSVVVSWS